MSYEIEGEQRNARSSSFFTTTATRTDRAIRNTAQKYISKIRTNDVETAIGNKPLTAAALAAAAGFAVGGGRVSGPGMVILALFACEDARNLAINLSRRDVPPNRDVRHLHSGILRPSENRCFVGKQRVELFCCV